MPVDEPQSDQPQSKEKQMREEIFQLWDAYRDYVVHEDLLFGLRLSRMLLVQGVLFAAGGGIITEFAKGMAQMHPINGAFPEFWARFGSLPVYVAFLLIIGIVGVATALLSRKEVRASNNSLVHLDELWKNKAEQANLLGLPGLLGAGNPKANFQQTEGNVLPVIFIIIWFVLGAFPAAVLLSTGLMGYSLPLAAQPQPIPIQVTCTSTNPSGSAISTRLPTRSIRRK